MELHSSSRPRRALIVEDEIVIALDLQDAMSAIGFDQCDLASSDRNARSLAMGSQPDVALVDVCLDGGREGIEAARWLREVCEVPVVFVTGCDDPATIERIHEQVPDAPVLTKPGYRKGLADAVAEVTAGIRMNHSLAAIRTLCAKVADLSSRPTSQRPFTPGASKVRLLTELTV